MFSESLIEILYESLEQEPANVIIYERIIEAWEAKNEIDAARETATQLLALDVGNVVATRCLQSKQETKPAVPSQRKFGSHKFTKAKPGRSTTKFNPKLRKAKTTPAGATKDADLLKGYQQLMLDAEHLEVEISGLLRHSGPSPTEEQQQTIAELVHISRGEVGDVVQSLQPVSAREVARAVVANRNKARELLVDDFETVVHWASSQSPPLSPETTRDRLVKRKTLLEAALPEDLAKHVNDALALMERQHLKKKYVNSETMYGDSIDEIPADHFFVSEDNYAWDMEELATALAVNDGVMRNPLSKEMFTETDIRQILAHPLGARLKPMQLAQSQLKQGVRPETLRRVEQLGKVLLGDQTENAGPSRSATDEFLAYMATLPEAEQKTIDSLKIPAKDKLNGRPYDYTIGQSVKDAKSNLTCFHKVGDFLTQAAQYLRNQ